MRKRLVAAGLLSVLLSACGSSGSGGGAGQEAPTGTVNKDAVLGFSFFTAAGSNYNPATSTNQFVNMYLYPVYDRLLDVGADGKLKPMLAESFQFMDGGRTLRLVLRTGVTFHDGTPFDATAVKANIDRGKTLPNSALKADLAAVGEVVVVDPKTVDLRLSAPAGSLPGLLADRAGMMVSPAAFANKDLDLKPVGTGPYKVVDHQPGVMITYDRFPKYWDPAAQTLGGIKIQMQPDSEARVRSLTDGQVAAAYLFADQAKAITQPGLKTESVPSLGSWTLFLNKTKPGLSDPRVRQALSLAIDREGISTALQDGRCAPSVQLFPKDYWAHAPGVEAPRRDPERAKKLLAEAGQSGLTLTAVTSPIPFGVAQLEAIQQQLAEVGVKLTVTSLEPTQLLSRFIGGQADMYYSLWPGATDPAKTVATLLSPQGTLNPGGYSNPEINRLALEGLSATDQDKRAPTYQKLSKAMVDDVMQIVVCNATNTFAHSTQVSNLQSTITGLFDLRGVTVSK